MADSLPAILDEQGFERRMGCLPRQSKVGDGTFRIFGEDGTPKTPRENWENWKQNTMEHLVWHVIDQASQGSCCASAGCGTTMLGREFAGLDRVVLSQASVYAFDGITSGGEPIPRRYDNGMAIDTCLQLLTKIGACPTSVISQYDWQGYRAGRWPENWREIALRYRILEALDCPTYDRAMEAVTTGFPVLYGAKGHAIVRVVWDKDLNSWGKDWGKNGIGVWATAVEMKRSIPSYGAWALRVTIDPTDDPTRK